MNHITEMQRYEIFAYIELDKSKVFIAKQLNVSKSSISREIARNSDIRNGKYKPALAQLKAKDRIDNIFN